MSKKRLPRYERLDTNAPTASIDFYRDRDEWRISQKIPVYRNDDNGSPVIIAYMQKVIDETEIKE